MKTSRRQELKTNELSIFLQQAYASLKQNLNYVIGGVVVVVVILVIAFIVQSRREGSRNAAWQKYTDLRSQAPKVEDNPALLQTALELAAENAGNGDLGLRTGMLAADMAFDLAMSKDPIKAKAERVKLLKDAKTQYQALMERYSDQPATVSSLRYSLAKVEESLLVAGEGTKAAVLAQYEPLAKEAHGMYKSLAAEQIKTLDERIQPVKVVATRPAEPTATAPATAPATRPALVQPEVSNAQRTPATVPAATQPQP